ncbi:SPOR domain-containing protein [Prolixibacteraceae bacterium Z1-6]|uniref:SPOR domain-containing protein n=1 Tax=Draconibacterium aestuarii TaxID=2998507 RepID=A0A9X3F3X3_9BACT|nr:SPOR domain-containing protein [Prolixibacteraceae bacterium Z1-6]
MDLKKTNAHLTIFLALLFASIVSYASWQENLLVKAILLFDAEKYLEAEQVLEQLVKDTADDQMINYYYGACRTENNHYGSNEIRCLLKGSSGETPLKTDYYLGVQYHAQSQWEEAIERYTLYQQKTGIEEQNKVGLSEKIQQCYNKINPFESDTPEAEQLAGDILPAPIQREKEIEEYRPIISEDNLTDSVSAFDLHDSLTTEDNKSVIIENTVAPVILQKTVQKTKPINFEINGEITYLDTANFKTEEGLQFYLEGQQKQNELDIKLNEVGEFRKKYAATNSYDEKQTIGEKILTSETFIYTLRSEIQQLMLQAKQVEIDYWNNVLFDEKEAFIKDLETYSKLLLQTEIIEEAETDTSISTNPQVLLATPNITTKVEEVTKDELIYKIQLGAYSRELPSYVKNQFKKLSYIRKIDNYTDEKGVVVYTTGNLTSYEDALKMQNQVKREGVEDAFIVPYFNGKRITLKEAKEIEAGK